MLDNIAHIKAYWVMLGKNLAQVAQQFGADDLDGTINHGGTLMESYLVEGNDNQLTSKEIEDLIRGAGRTPIERDTLYNPIERAISETAKQSRSTLPVIEANPAQANNLQ